MRKLTKNDMIENPKKFTTIGQDGKEYSFKIVAMFAADSGDHVWCVSRPDMEYPKDVDPESAVLFKVTQMPGKEDVSKFELIEDDDIIDEVFDAFNTYVDERIAELEKNKNQKKA